jgi:hypothetical protein
MRQRGRLILVVAGIAIGALPPAPSRGSEIERPAQLDAAQAVGLAYSRVHPASVRRVCVVDSGAAANIDTRRVVARLSFDSAAGDDADQRYRHGTSMAMHMAAERNGEGMVGVWPLGELISYQVVPPGAAQARFVDYARAVRVCSEEAGVAVIALAIADGQEPTGDEAARLQDALAHARANDIMVVASAGNTGGSVSSPGSFAGVFAVAAGSGAHMYCDFASRGPEVQLRAPGCGLEEASPFTLMARTAEGSSQAAAMTAQVAAALRSYAPSLSVDETEAALRSAGEDLDVAAAFRSVGLGHVIDDGLAVAPPVPGVGEPPRSGRLPRPRLVSLVVGRRCAHAVEFFRARCRPIRRPFRMVRGRALLVLRSLPRRAAVEVKVLSRTDRDARASPTFVRRSRRFTVPVEASWRALRVRLVPRRDARILASRPVLVWRR